MGEFIECRYIGLFRISNSISYRTSHIENLDILKTNDFFVFFRRKFQKIAKNSSKRRSSLRPSYRIVSYRIEKKTLISYRYRIESKKSLSLLSAHNIRQCHFLS